MTQHLRACGAALAIALGIVVSNATVARAQVAPPPQPAPLTQPPKPVTTNLGGNESPPQPQLPQSLDYFVGSWTYSWNGRESGLGGGPRMGTIKFSRSASGRNLLDVYDFIALFAPHLTHDVVDAALSGADPAASEPGAD